MTRSARSPLLTLLLCGGCTTWFRSPPAPAWSSDLAAPSLAGAAASVDTIARGVLRRSFVMKHVPWAIHMLDVDRSACWSLVALKSGTGVRGRERASELMRRRAAQSVAVAGGVNADFFLFDPPGVPLGAHVADGRVVAGPADRPVVALDSTGRPWIGTLRVVGRASSGRESVPVSGWNRLATDGLSFFDGNYGTSVDSVRGSVRIGLATPSGGAVRWVDTTALPTAIPPGGSLLIVGRDSPGDLRARILLLARTRARFDVRVQLTPVQPRDAVGGFPVLVHDSAEVPGLDSAGSATLGPVRHPRTIIAVAAAGRRLMLVTVDGRQPGYSLGMTLPESARLALELGATQALNLDGGGSTTLVVAKRGGTAPRYEIANRPSDAAGERAVGNALAVVPRC